jgi:hypothetical protein
VTSDERLIAIDELAVEVKYGSRRYVETDRLVLEELAAAVRD